MNISKNTLLALLLSITLVTQAQETLTIDSCRTRALRANRTLKQAEVKVEQTKAMEQAALWQMLPKVTANGGYLWMEKSINLLSEEQKDRIGHLGDNISAEVASSLHEQLDGVPLVGSQLADAIANALAGSNLTTSVNEMGQQIVQGLETDTRNMGGAAITLTQPIYMGGKLAALHRTAQLSAHLSGVELDKKKQETLLAVDEAYWQVVSIGHKKRLAKQYATLLDTLESHVQMLFDAQMATQGDLAQVRVKHNEAEMNLTKASNGYLLAKMLLAERCGMPLDSEYILSNELDSETNPTEDLINHLEHSSIDTSHVYAQRAEMQMLRIADSIAQQGVRVAASVLKPNVVVSGGYLLTNPNVFDGFSNTWGGTWMAGVVVNVPLVHPAGIYALRAAKAKRKQVQFQMEEAREMIALQLKKLDFELDVAYKHLAQAQSDLEAANENLTLADESFKAGMCSSSDLMAAQTAWMKAKNEVIDARIEVQMSQVYLHQAMGE